MLCGGERDSVLWILIEGAGYELKVWEKCGTELVGIFRLEFAWTLLHWWQKKELFQSVDDVEWCLTFLPERLMSVHRLIRQSDSVPSIDSYHTAEDSDEETAADNRASSSSGDALTNQIRSCGSKSSCSVQ